MSSKINRPHNGGVVKQQIDAQMSKECAGRKG